MALWNAVFDISASDRALGILNKKKRISNQFWVSKLSRYKLNCWHNNNDDGDDDDDDDDNDNDDDDNYNNGNHNMPLPETVCSCWRARH